MRDRLAAVMRPLRPIVLTLVAALLLVACSGGPGAPGAPGSPSGPQASASASAVPAPSTAGSSAPTNSNAASGGGVGGNPGTGVTPIPIAPSGPGMSPGPAPSRSPTEVQPVAGLLNVHDVRATALEGSVSNGRLITRVFWWSGPPPCSELSEVKVDRTGTTFTLTIREGARQLGVACSALAMSKVTTVDLGPVSPGGYTVKALGVEPGIAIPYTG